MDTEAECVSELYADDVVDGEGLPEVVDDIDGLIVREGLPDEVNETAPEFDTDTVSVRGADCDGDIDTEGLGE
jgi:hypothetical protein